MALISNAAIETKTKMLDYLNGNLRSQSAYQISTIITKEIHREKMASLERYNLKGERFIPFSEPFPLFVPTDMLDRLSAYYAPVMENEGIYYLNYQPCDDKSSMEEVRDNASYIVRSLFNGTYLLAQEIAKRIRMHLTISGVYVIDDYLTVGFNPIYDINVLIETLNKEQGTPYLFYRQNNSIKCYSCRDHSLEDRDVAWKQIQYILKFFIEAQYADRLG